MVTLAKRETEEFVLVVGRYETLQNLEQVVPASLWSCRQCHERLLQQPCVDLLLAGCIGCGLGSFAVKPASVWAFVFVGMGMAFLMEWRNSRKVDRASNS